MVVVSQTITLNIIVKQGCSIVHARAEANTSKLWLDSLHSVTTLSPPMLC